MADKPGLRRQGVRAGKPAATPLAFIMSFGVVSMLMDVVYQGALSVQGPLLASLGASAALVGIVSGVGEATSLAGRLVSGPTADRTGRYWLFAILGYAITGLAVPAMGFAGSVAGVSVLVIVERLGKSLRTPSRDAMLSHAAAKVGRGKGFALHEVMDQIGAFAGPLAVAAILQLTHNAFGPALGIMLVPGLAAIAVLLVLRRRVPDPTLYEEDAEAGTESDTVARSAAAAEPAAAAQARPAPAGKTGLPREFWAYTCFCGLMLAGIGTFGVMSFHMVQTGVTTTPMVPVLYAVAQAVDAVFALVSGSLYDRFGTKTLLALPVVSALIPLFAYTDSFALVLAGVVLWGASLGIQESTMRAAVADMIPGGKRATSYGFFSVATGIGSLVGAAVTGTLYDGPGFAAIAVYSVAVEAAALVLLARTLHVARQDRQS